MTKDDPPLLSDLIMPALTEMERRSEAAKAAEPTTEPAEPAAKAEVTEAPKRKRPPKRKPVPADRPALLTPGEQSATRDESAPNAGDLVTAWTSAYVVARGATPHPGMVARVAGICRTLARRCESLDDWRVAWRAARAAGDAGRWDVVPYLVHPRITESDVPDSLLREPQQGRP